MESSEIVDSSFLGHLRFSKPGNLTFVPEKGNPYSQLKFFSTGRELSMDSMAAGTSVENARCFVFETVELLLNRHSDESLGSQLNGQQVNAIVATVSSFLANARKDDPVLIGIFDTGLSEESLVKTLFNNEDLNTFYEHRSPFDGWLGYGNICKRQTTFSVSSELLWISPYPEDSPSLIADDKDAQLVVTERTVWDERHDSVAWTEERVRPVATYGKTQNIPLPRLSLPLGWSNDGQVCVADLTSNTSIVDPNGVFQGGVMKVTIFRRKAALSKLRIPSNSLHIQISPTGLVCSVGVYGSSFGKFTRDLSNLRDVFTKGGAS